MVNIFCFILGYAVCFASLWKLLTDLRADNQKLINEWSIRTGGRPVYREPKPEALPLQQANMGEFSLMTPTMAEMEAEGRAEEFDMPPAMSEADLKHLRKARLIQ